ncbi:carboxypeptidase-like regulatory domain-containing protein [Flavobacteriaceae bacterium]|nr:carboxypeptidase-like regulatory domain-containing protein [Flavobacteriaceae bacterium]MDB9913272.1 carboxypeptidase-like regulatory domain-containing protein [Flavobacteriaceae bacterium]MDB9993868.1 carboxypeptidase-like regulatory domain-containing protein [Flavobacteriaceae bacterium]
MKKITFYLVVSFLFVNVISFAQGTITGTINDSDLGGPLSGANIVEYGTDNGAITDFDGNFELTVVGDEGTLSISYLGYTTQTYVYELSDGVLVLEVITLEPDPNALSEVVVIGTGVVQLAAGRATPTAVSTISAEEIELRGGANRDITESIAFTPSATVTGNNGFGDSQLFLRGFDQTNIAVLLNGQPVNGMEDGKVYWSNWSGLSDIATTIEVQRGLGASRLAISSVGGTTNIVMKAADKKQGGFVRFTGANDSYMKATAGYDSGMNEKGWAFSVLLDYWQAHRKWSEGTYGQGQTYYFSVGYKASEKHNFNFLVTGSPQLHGQKWSQSKERIAANPKYNQHWGYLNEDGTDISSERQNFYHKPVANLNWDFTVSDKTTLSTVAYASWGRGGGTGPRGNGRIRTADVVVDGVTFPGQLDYPAIEEANTAIGVGGDYGAPNGAGYIRRGSMNNHAWYGLVSNLNHDFSDNLSASVGVDARFYKGDHFRQVVDLYGLTGWSNDRPDDAVVTNTYEANPWSTLFDYAPEEDRIAYDNSEQINYQGVFGQLEYATDKFTIFAQGAFSNQSYEREDRFDDGVKSDKISKTGYNIKGGLSYNINPDNTIFFNAGHYSRQPYLDNVFNRNRGQITEPVSPAVDNEQITSFEAGYHIKANRFRANFNAYATNWSDRTLSNFDTDDNGTPDDDVDDFDITVLQRGITQFHTGAELDVYFRATDWLTINGFISGGSWYYKGEAEVSVYNADTSAQIGETTNVDRDGIKVSTAPQFTTGIGFDAKIVEGLSIDARIKYNDNHYEFTDVNTSKEDFKGVQLDSYALTNAGLTYRFNVGDNNMTFRANVFNVFDKIAINQSDRFGYFITGGRTFNASMRYEF